MTQNSSFIVKLKKISPLFREIVLLFVYRKHTGKFPDCKNPKTWSEKLLWLNKNWEHSFKARLTDKYEVKSYLSDLGLSEYIIENIGIWDNVDEIDFASLPQRFVLKGTHGCMMNIICNDKDTINIDKVKSTMKGWLTKDWSLVNNEKHYHLIKPRILCEAFLPVSDVSQLNDYKIHCFDGIPRFIGVCYDRQYDEYQTKGSKGIIYSTNWDRLFYLKDDQPNDNISSPRPDNLDEMLHLATLLSKNIPYVRVDLYNINGKIYFGEMTFSPDGNIPDGDYKKEIVMEYGKYITLPK